ncbi:mitotic-spindle organizing protein 1-like [Cimex lectularius]|uniref:Mitotic-spindle organizing protein 1 n=1 Tax=Cimex lectularius TaxID=79782 RepID=A0A8I6RJI2_CIMLE|nr:mitotic-spindle organizing protein 1-like [Cimex lectularius]
MMESRKIMKAKRSKDNISELEENKVSSAKVGFNALYEISQLLNCGLDRQSLAICSRLCQDGVQPEALANIIIMMRNQAEEYRSKQDGNKTQSNGNK